MWHFAGAYRPGSSHLERQLPCQDFCTCEEVLAADGARVLVVVVSDGAGSASRSEVGALAICHTMLACAKQFLSDPQAATLITPDLARAWARQTLKVLIPKATAMGVTARDVAATCLGMVVWPDRALCWQLGDGAMVVDAGAEELEVCFWPMRGEHANETDFLTDLDAVERIDARIIERPINSLAAFTDGIQMVVLHNATRTASRDFFLPYFATMRTTPPGRHPSVDDAIGDLISRPSILARTDDDRTLVIAVRHPPIAPSPNPGSNGGQSPATPAVTETPIADVTLATQLPPAEQDVSDDRKRRHPPTESPAPPCAP